MPKRYRQPNLAILVQSPALNPHSRRREPTPTSFPPVTRPMILMIWLGISLTGLERRNSSFRHAHILSLTVALHNFPSMGKKGSGDKHGITGLLILALRSQRNNNVSSRLRWLHNGICVKKVRGREMDTGKRRSLGSCLEKRNPSLLVFFFSH